MQRWGATAQSFRAPLLASPQIITEQGPCARLLLIAGANTLPGEGRETPAPDLVAPKEKEAVYSEHQAMQMGTRSGGQIKCYVNVEREEA